MQENDKTNSLIYIVLTRRKHTATPETMPSGFHVKVMKARV